MIETRELRTNRLRLRQLQVDDAEALHPSMSDEAMMKYWSRAPTRSVDETRDYFRPVPGMEDWRSWAITLPEDDRAIGWVSVGERRQGGVAELGYLLANEWHGHGYAREAVTAVIDHLFAIENHRRVFADTDPDNVASIRVLQALGFTLEGRLRGEWETHIGVRDSLIWGLLKREWRQ